MKCYSQPIIDHAEVPERDSQQLEALLSRWDKPVRSQNHDGSNKNNCYIACPGSAGDCPGQLYEIKSLVQSLGDCILGHETVSLLRPNPRTLVGTGKAREIAARAAALGADLLVVDAALSPSQMRNLEDIVAMAVCDREAVILNVFMKHARTKRSKIQVEVAHLEYLRPRIRGLGLDMDQQASAIVTGRGPGETASALLARKLDGRLAELRKALAAIQTAHQTQRRKRSGCKQIALAGYTNAGKTSLMNALAGVSLAARNRPFETLDTKTCRLSAYGGDVLLSDTVGFIRRLPDRLLASFESTLEGIRDASLIALVVDISSQECKLHVATTLKVLKKLGADNIPRLFVFNKTDRLPIAPTAGDLSRLSRDEAYFALSSRDPDAVSGLRERLLSMARSDIRCSKIFVPYAGKQVFNLIYGQCRVLSVDAAEAGLYFSLEGAPHVIREIEEKVKEVCHE